MGYSFSTLDDGRILLLTVDSHYDLAHEMVASSQEVTAYLDAAAQRVVLITDARAVQIKDMNSLLMGAQNITHPEVKKSVKHSKLLKYLSVVDNKLAQVATKGLNHATFGYFEPMVFDSVDAAIEQARLILAKSSHD
jgi:hypothetical protein